MLEQLGTQSFDADFRPDSDNYKGVVDAAIDVTVGPADGRNLKTVELVQKYTDTEEHTYAPDWSALPKGQQWTFDSEASEVLPRQDFAADGSLLTYAIPEGKALGDQITITLKASCANYEDFTITLHILLREKDEGAGFQPGHLDQRLHQKVQLVDLAFHGAQKFRLLFRRELVLLQDVGEHLDVGDGRLDLVGDVTDQALDGLLVPLALALALAHDVEVLHQLPLHLGGQAVLVGLIVLRLPAGKQGVERLAQVVGKQRDLPPLIPRPQPHHRKDGGAQSQNAVPHRAPGNGAPQNPHQRGKKHGRKHQHAGAQDLDAAMFHDLPPVQMYPMPRTVLM